MSRTLLIEMEDEVFLGLQKNPEELASEIRIAAAIKWYELGMLSQCKAAQVAGLSRAEFINSLSRFSVSLFQETTEEVVAAVRQELDAQNKNEIEKK